MFDNIVTERLVLRCLEPGDATCMFAYRSDPEVARYQGFEPGEIGEIETFIADQVKLTVDTPDTWFQLAITLKATGEMIGDLGLHFLAAESEQVELGITLAPTHQGQGLASEACHGALDHVFGTLRKHRVYGSLDPRNTASAALMERIGMRKEAHLVESLRFKGAWVDDIIYGMLRREWESRRDASP